MSLAASSLVWDRSRATGSALLVLLSLAERANKDHSGVSWSKVESVAKRTRLGKRQAQRAIAELVDLRELYVHHAYGRGGTNAFVVTCGRSREFVTQALMERIGISRELAESIASSATNPVEKGVTDDAFSTRKGDTQDTHSDPGKGDTRDTLSSPEKGDMCDTLSDERMTPATPFEAGKGCHIRQERVTNPVEKGVTDDVPPRPPIRKNQHEPLENHRRRRARMSGPASAPARIDDDDDFLELVLVEFESRTGRTRKPADELAARSLRGTNLESVRRGIAKSVAAVGDGRVSSLRYCVPAIEEAERLRAQASVGAAPRPVAVPDPEPDDPKTPIFAAVAKFLKRSASMYGRVPDRGEIRDHLILECGHDPGLVEAMYPTGNGSSASSPGQVFTTASAAKE